MKLTLPVRLAPTPEQDAALLATVARFNDACHWIAEVAYREQIANKVRLQQVVYYDVRERFGLSAQMAIRAIGKVVEAFKRDKSVRPRFRPRGAMPYDERIMSFRGPTAVSLLTLEGRQVIGMTLGGYQQARVDRRQGQADLIWRDGKWYLYLTVDVADHTPVNAAAYIGVDLGVVNIAADSDGNTHTADEIEEVRVRNANLRAALQRKGTKSAKRHLRRVSGREARFRRDVNHQVSKQLVRIAKDTGRGIALEDLRGIRDRTTVRRVQHARHHSWSFRQLRAFVEYKAALAGVPVAVVDPRDTSRTCAQCGHCEKANRRNQAEFACRSCGHAAPADINAARNIAAKATAGVMQPIVSTPDAASAAA